MRNRQREVTIRKQSTEVVALTHEEASQKLSCLHSEMEEQAWNLTSRTVGKEQLWEVCGGDSPPQTPRMLPVPWMNVPSL